MQIKWDNGTENNQDGAALGGGVGGVKEAPSEVTFDRERGWL